MQPNPEHILSLIDELKRRGLPIPPELEYQARQIEIAKRGLLTYATFRDYVAALNPTLLDYEHTNTLVDVADRVVRGVLFRVLILLPPRYFKTETFGKLLSSYYLRRHPRRAVGVSSFGADRAWEISEASRNYYQQAHGQIREEAQAKKRWVTPEGGELWAVGMGGQIMGRGYHLGLVDDPIHPEQARSPVYRKRFRNWWPEVWLSRQNKVPHTDGVVRQPNHEHTIGQILLVMQRLGPEDPIDFLLRREVGEGVELAPQHWHVVAMDEIKSEEPLGRWNGPMGLPPTCTLEPDHRKPGEVLSPSWLPLDTVQAARREFGPLTIAAQRQQRPALPEGDFWRTSDFGEYAVLPSNAYNGGWDWDTAFTADERNSASAGIQSFRGPKDPVTGEWNIYIEDVDWEWLEFPALVAWLRRVAGPHYLEEKATGKSAIQALAAHGIKAKPVPVKGDKLARASAVQPTVANGRVLLNKSIVQKLLWGERQGLARVSAESLQTGGEGLDVNDAFVQALTRHLGIGGRRRVMVG